MKPKITLLLAEDEPSLGRIIKESLETRGFDVLLCENGEKAFEVYKTKNPKLLILDIMMPKKDGISLAKDIRLENTEIPIIFLTSKSQTQDVVEGFHSGGNDYIKKPFSMEELIVRINNLLKNTLLQEPHNSIKLGAYVFDFTKQTLQFKNEPSTTLTHREAHLLFHLIKNKNKVLERSLILNKLWGNDDYFSSRSMDVFITKIRKKLNQDQTIQILNVRGFGYKLIY